MIKLARAYVIFLTCFALLPAGCGQPEHEGKKFRLLPEEMGAYEAPVNPNVALYEEPEQEDEIDAAGKFIYLGWLAKDGILPDNPWRSDKYTPYAESSDKDLQKIDADMWSIMEQRKIRIEEKKREEASRPRVISY